MNQHFCLHNLVVNSRIGNPYTGQTANNSIKINKINTSSHLKPLNTKKITVDRIGNPGRDWGQHKPEACLHRLIEYQPFS
jgi:hypothetical protein